MANDLHNGDVFLIRSDPITYWVACGETLGLGDRQHATHFWYQNLTSARGAAGGPVKYGNTGTSLEGIIRSPAGSIYTWTHGGIPKCFYAADGEVFMRSTKASYLFFEKGDAKPSGSIVQVDTPAANAIRAGNNWVAPCGTPGPEGTNCTDGVIQLMKNNNQSVEFVRIYTWDKSPYKYDESTPAPDDPGDEPPIEPPIEEPPVGEPPVEEPPSTTPSFWVSWWFWLLLSLAVLVIALAALRFVS